LLHQVGTSRHFHLEGLVSFATIIRVFHMNTGKIQLPKLRKESHLMLL